MLGLGTLALHDAAATGEPKMLAALAAIPLCIWLYLLLGAAISGESADKFAPLKSSVVPMKRVIAVIPARNEATVIAESLLSLFAQGISIILIDDNSSDGTAEVARHAQAALGHSDRLTVIQGKPLAAGWTGKLLGRASRGGVRRSIQARLSAAHRCRHHPWTNKCCGTSCNCRERALTIWCPTW